MSRATAPRGCVRVPELTAALDGRLDRAATEAALRHALGCASCRDARQAHADLRALARALPGYAPDELTARRVRAGVMRAALGSAPPRRAGAGVFAVAALLLVALAGIVVPRVGILHVPGGTSRGTSRGAPADTPSDAPGVPRGVALAGAGVMEPAPGAVVAVRRAGADTRIELTAGEVTFAVEHRRPGERFVVATADAEVEVRGTRFQLTARDGRLARVVVTAGLVAVRRAGDAERFVPAGATLDLPPAAPAPPAPATPPPVAVATAADGAHAHPTPRHAPGTLARDFRDGALAYVRGEPAAAALALHRFLDAAAPADPRREDARYVLVLSLVRAGRGGEAEAAANAYLREFPRGLRRPEVVTELALAAARRGDCDLASAAALGLPEDADARLRESVARALAACRGR